MLATTVEDGAREPRGHLLAYQAAVVGVRLLPVSALPTYPSPSASIFPMKNLNTGQAFFKTF